MPPLMASASKSNRKQQLSYPSEFSTDARNRIEAERIKAYRHFEEAPAVRWDSDREALLRKCILRIFLAFAREACALGKRKMAAWSLDQVDDACREFLRGMTVQARYDHGFRSAMSRFSGVMDHRLERAFRASVEWQEYERLKLDVAEPHTGAHEMPRTKPGPKPDIETARRVAEIVSGLASSKWQSKLGDICESLDEQKVPPPRIWRKKGVLSWSDAADDHPDLAKKAIQHHLKNAPRP